MLFNLICILGTVLGFSLSAKDTTEIELSQVELVNTVSQHTQTHQHTPIVRAVEPFGNDQDVPWWRRMFEWNAQRKQHLRDDTVNRVYSYLSGGLNYNYALSDSFRRTTKAETRAGSSSILIMLERSLRILSEEGFRSWVL